ncbi:MAG: sensor histidine kinase [Xanthomonadales bacterium]|nr:sensor histidine kinase [Xanthomonadales bacterium]
MQSIASKLTAGLILSLIIAFTALWILVSFSVQFMAKEYIASRLEHDAEVLLNAINFDQNGVFSVENSRTDLIYKQPFSGHYYVVSSADRSISSRSLWDHKLQITPVKIGQKTQSFQPGPDQQSLLLLSAAYQKQKHKLTISIAEDLNPINKNIEQFKYWFAALAAGMLMALVLIQTLILRKSLTPVNRIHTDLKLLQKGRLKKLNTEAPGELQPLLYEVNHLLGILEQRLRRSRDALSDLAHAIKKPLTVIKQITDKDLIPEATHSTLVQQTEYIQQISDHILKRARLAGHSHTGTLFSFADDLAPLIKTLEMMHSQKTIRLTINAPKDLPCPVDREDMLELLGNLLDNAYKWANNEVILSIDIDSEVYISIEDDGAGIDLDKISELSKRGVRMDEKIQGHGFGLAIIADIVNDYRGSITFKHSADLGGFKADIVLPLQRNNK